MDDMGGALEALTTAEVNVLLVVLAIITIAAVGAGAVMLARALLLVGTKATEAMSATSEALGTLGQATSEIASASRSTRDLLEHIEDNQRAAAARLTTIQDVSTQGLNAARGGRTDIAEVHEIIERGFRDTKTDIGGVQTSILARLDTLQSALDSAERRHAERISATSEQHAILMAKQDALNRERKHHEKIYREQLDTILTSIDMLRAMVQRAPSTALALPSGASSSYETSIQHKQGG